MLTPEQLEQLKQILAEVIYENSGEKPLDEQAIQALFDEKFAKYSIEGSIEIWQQLDKILIHKTDQEIPEPNQVQHYTAAIASVIYEEIKEHKPKSSGEVFMPKASQLESSAGRSTS